MRTRGSWRDISRHLRRGTFVTCASVSLALGAAPLRAHQTANLVVDPGFEAGTGMGDWSVQQPGSLIARTTDNPIAGAASLRVVPEGYGANIWWGIDYTGGFGSGLHVSG